MASARIGRSRAAGIGAFVGLAGITSLALATALQVDGVAAANGAHGTLYFTRKAGPGDRVKSIVFTYDGTSFSFAQAGGSNATMDVAATPGADGLAFSPGGSLIVGGQGKAVYEVNAGTHTFNTVSPGGVHSYYVAMDPGGKVAWTGGSPGGVSGGFASVPVDPAATGTAHSLSGDDTALEELVFNPATPNIAFYTASLPGGNGGRFGCINMSTFHTFHLLDTAAAHGLAFDTFSNSLLMFGNNLIAQVSPPATCTAQTTAAIAHTHVPASGTHHFDAATVDGQGHAYVTESGGNLYFLDYASGGISAPTHEFRVFLDAEVDHVGLPPAPPITTVPMPAAALVGSSIHDTAHVASAIAGIVPTGTVDFSLYAPGDNSCAKPVFTSAGRPLNNTGDAVSGTYAVPSAGQSYHWRAHYSGDQVYPSSDSTCAEPVSVSIIAATIATKPSAGGPVGIAVHDVATVTGLNPTGTVTFSLYSPNDPGCSHAPVFASNPVMLSGGTATSPSFTTALAGTYQWKAVYSGDPNNAPATGTCGAEPVSIDPVGASQGITTGGSSDVSAPNTGVGTGVSVGLGLVAAGALLSGVAAVGSGRRRAA